MSCGSALVRPHSGGGQIDGDDRSQTARSGEEDTGRFKLLLPRLPEHEDLSLVPFLLFFGNHTCFSAHNCIFVSNRVKLL